jgi:DNA-binding FadR family transcriptional regulator
VSTQTSFRVPKLAELIAEQIHRDIAAGRLQAGDSLPSESTIMTSFGASRPPVREAIRILESDGLIAVRRGARGGISVVRPDQRTVAAKIRNAIKLWGTDASEAAALVAGAELAAVRALADRCRETGQAPAIEISVTDQRFHRKLVEYSGASLANTLTTALGEMGSSLCTDALAHTRALCSVERGEVDEAVGIWRAHQAC